MSTKTMCVKCLQWKDESEFYTTVVKRGRKTYRYKRHECIRCSISAATSRRARRPDVYVPTDSRGRQS